MEAEKVIRRSKNALILQLIIAVILIPIFGIGFIIGAVALIQYSTQKLIIKKKSIIQKKGLIGSYTKEIPFSKVNGVNIDQDIGGKLFGYGSVKIVTGNDTDTIKFDALEDPEKVKKLIQMLVEKNDPAHTHNKMSNTSSGSSHESRVMHLEKLAALKEKGILSEEEFQKEKTKILSS